MIDASMPNTKNQKRAQVQRITPSSSYREYSWDAIAGQPRPPYRNAAQNNQGAAVGRTVNRSSAAAPAGQKRFGGRHGQASGISAGTAANRSAGRTAQGKAQAGRTASGAGKASAAAKKSTAARTAREAVKVQAEKAERIRRKSIVAIHTIMVERKYSFPMSVVLIALSFTILVMAIVTTTVQISEITLENSALERQYNTMFSEMNELQLRLETRDDLRVVEAMAKDELGMVKKDEVERYRLTVQKEDKIEIIEEVREERFNILEGIMSFGGSVVERIRAFFNL